MAPRVIIVGGGFAGLAAARDLAKAEVEITLIDRHNHHLFQPLLYQVATAALAPETSPLPFAPSSRARPTSRYAWQKSRPLTLAHGWFTAARKPCPTTSWCSPPEQPMPTLVMMSGPRTPPV